MIMAERRTSTLLRALTIGVVTLQLSWSVESIVAYGARHNKLQMTGDVHADYKAYMKLNPDLKRDSTRFEFFKRNYQRILDHDAEKAGYSLGLTKFTGYTDEELALISNNRLNDAADGTTENSIVNFNSPNAKMSQPESVMDERDVPTSYSWSDRGKVTAIKDQGQCGSCYAFAATAAVESAYAIKTGKLVDYSPQQYISCSKGFLVWQKGVWNCNETHCVMGHTDESGNVTWGGNSVCDGGNFISCWFYHNKTGHLLNSETCYPYVHGSSSKEVACQLPTDCSSALSVCGYRRVPSNDATALKSMIVKYGPAACSLSDGGKYDFYIYEKGIFSGPRGPFKHAVTVVGFSQTPAGEQYWIVKHSWGDDWGMSGYGWINGDGVNDLSITSECAIPIIC